MKIIWRKKRSRSTNVDIIKVPRTLKEFFESTREVRNSSLTSSAIIKGTEYELAKLIGLDEDCFLHVERYGFGMYLGEIGIFFGIRLVVVADHSKESCHTKFQREAYLYNLWRWKLGLPERNICSTRSLSEARKIQRNQEFRSLCQNRLVIGGYRYGFMDDPGQEVYRRHEALEKAWATFKRTGNADSLADVANYAELIYDAGSYGVETVDDQDHDPAY